MLAFFGIIRSLLAGINVLSASSAFQKFKDQIAQNIDNNLENSLILLVTGMVGIFVVMIILMAVIVVLNKVTADKNDDKEEK